MILHPEPREPVTDHEPFVQLVTRIPKTLHLALKLHGIRRDTKLQTLVADALREKLAASR